VEHEGDARTEFISKCRKGKICVEGGNLKCRCNCLLETLEPSDCSVRVTGNMVTDPASSRRSPQAFGVLYY
jgi:hypothetical protein